MNIKFSNKRTISNPKNVQFQPRHPTSERVHKWSKFSVEPLQDLPTEIGGSSNDGRETAKTTEISHQNIKVL